VRGGGLWMTYAFRGHITSEGMHAVIRLHRRYSMNVMTPQRKASSLHLPLFKRIARTIQHFCEGHSSCILATNICIKLCTTHPFYKEEDQYTPPPVIHVPHIDNTGYNTTPHHTTPRHTTPSRELNATKNSPIRASITRTPQDQICIVPQKKTKEK
jgi:hypothetical protein